MKTILLYFLLLALAFSVGYFTGCADDSVSPPSIGNPTQQDSLLFEKDSLSVSINNISNDSIYNNFRWNNSDTSIHKIKIIFIGETNFDSTKGVQIIQIGASNYFSNFCIRIIGKTSINQTHNIIQSAISFAYMTFYVIINKSFDSTYKYLKAKNIKIYKTN